jgi:hypothetical protein
MMRAFFRDAQPPGFPPAGTPFVVTLSPVSRPQTMVTLRSNAFTTEGIVMRGPGGGRLADARLGQPLTVSWTLPVTYQVDNLDLYGNVESAQYRCDADGPDVGPRATTGTVTFPATCRGEAVTRAYVNVSTRGPNGERSVADWSFQ